MKLITTSTVCAGSREERPGGLYMIDLDDRSVVRRNLARRGRGPRGIAFDGDTIWLASREELFAYTPEFGLIESWRNPYLRGCRELAVYERTLYVVASTFDSVIGFDLDAHKFRWAMQIATDEHRFAARQFDPHGKEGPLPASKLDLDSLHCNVHGMYLGGTRSGGLLHFNGSKIRMAAELPGNPRNAQPFRDGVLFNDTEADALRYSGRHEGQEDRAMSLPDGAHPGSGRGLCVISDSVVAGGSTPATVTLYDLAGNRQLLSVRLEQDAGEAIHTIAAWPYD